MRAALFVFSVCVASACAAEFRVGAGLSDFQVIQRGPGNFANIPVGGSAEGLAGKPIEARILAGGKPLKGWNWRPVAVAGGATWAGALDGVPTGGPYTIELRARGATPALVKSVLVGDIWVLTGESGTSITSSDDPRVHRFERDRGWQPATGAADTTAVAFGVELLRRTGVPVGVISLPPMESEPGRLAEIVGGKFAGIVPHRANSAAELADAAARMGVPKLPSEARMVP